MVRKIDEALPKIISEILDTRYPGDFIDGEDTIKNDCVIEIDGRLHMNSFTANKIVNLVNSLGDDWNVLSKEISDHRWYSSVKKEEM